MCVIIFFVYNILTRCSAKESKHKYGKIWVQAVGYLNISVLTIYVEWAKFICNIYSKKIRYPIEVFGTWILIYILIYIHIELQIWKKKVDWVIMSPKFHIAWNE